MRTDLFNVMRCFCRDHKLFIVRSEVTNLWQCIESSDIGSDVTHLQRQLAWCILTQFLMTGDWEQTHYCSSSCLFFSPFSHFFFLTALNRNYMTEITWKELTQQRLRVGIVLDVFRREVSAPQCLCTVWKPTTACSCVHNRTVTNEMVPNYIKSFLLTLWLAPFSTLGWKYSLFVFIPNTQSYNNTYLRGSPDHLEITKWKMMYPIRGF